MSPSTSTVSIHIKITVAPQNADLFLAQFKPAYDRVRAEPRLLFFEVYYNPAVPGEFRWVEDWDASLEWLKEVQLKKEYYEPYGAAMEPLRIKPRELEIWQRFPGNQWVLLRRR